MPALAAELRSDNTLGPDRLRYSLARQELLQGRLQMQRRRQSHRFQRDSSPGTSLQEVHRVVREAPLRFRHQTRLSCLLASTEVALADAFLPDSRGRKVLI